MEGEPAAAALADDELAALLEGATTPDPRFGTLRDVQYLRWRYGSVPGFDYRAIRARKAGRLSGLAIFRGHRTARPWKTSLVELISAPDDRQVARRLVRQVGSASGADYLACHFPAGSAAARAARRSGFVRSQHRVSLVTDPFRGDLRPDPVDVRNWTMSLGDLELL